MTAGPIVLYSSIWIEIFGAGPLSSACMKALRSAKTVIVPTVVVYEVYRKIVSSTGSDDEALSAIGLLRQHEVRDLTAEVALSAADLSLRHGLGMADSLVLAHAEAEQATLVTLDNDFSDVAGARVLRRS